MDIIGYELICVVYLFKINLWFDYDLVGLYDFIQWEFDYADLLGYVITLYRQLVGNQLFFLCFCVFRYKWYFVVTNMQCFLLTWNKSLSLSSNKRLKMTMVSNGIYMNFKMLCYEIKYTRSKVNLVTEIFDLFSAATSVKSKLYVLVVAMVLTRSTCCK